MTQRLCRGWTMWYGTPRRWHLTTWWRMTMLSPLLGKSVSSIVTPLMLLRYCIYWNDGICILFGEIRMPIHFYVDTCRWFLHGWAVCQSKVIWLKPRLFMIYYALWSKGVFLSYFICFSSSYLVITFCWHWHDNDRSDAEILGPNNQYLPKIIFVFAEVLHSVSAFHIYINKCY